MLLLAALVATGQFIQADVQCLGDSYHGIEVRHGIAGFPAVVDAWANAEQFGEAGLIDIALAAQCAQPLSEVGHVQHDG